LIDSNLQSSGAGITNETQGHRALAPQFLVANFKVRNFDWQTRLLSDGNALSNSIGDLIAFLKSLE